MRCLVKMMSDADQAWRLMFKFLVILNSNISYTILFLKFHCLDFDPKFNSNTPKKKANSKIDNVGIHSKLDRKNISILGGRFF